MNQSGVRSGRLLSILLLLQARRTATARELAAHLGVSMRTVYRDVEVLSQMGVPLYAENGRGGGYRLVDGYRTTLTGLTSQESLALFLIGLPAPAASLGLTEQARSAEAKLLAALGPHHEERANRLRDRFLLDLPAWYSYATTPAALPTLADALLTNRRVHVSYWRWAEPREVRRTLDPHGLVVKNGVWYLVAADRTRGTTSPLRTYRVSNILELHTEDVTFERVTPFDLAEFWQHHLTDFDRRRLTATAHIRVAPELVAELPDLGDSSLADAVRHGSRDEQGWVLAELPIESAAKGAVQLIGYGGGIEVVSPPELRTELVALAKAVLKQYANGSGLSEG
ncbi:WYL domain-containing protein [Amycolatopsis sp. NPDC005232]|uniref:helix-turn-helix transcriptional regulator n=1 Tax=Amycolatopsis sp. NPDC005232 TaxID=3157027 RepID=UPI0033BB4BF5